MNISARARQASAPSWSRTLVVSLLLFVIALGFHSLLRNQYRSDPFSSTYISDALSYHTWATTIADRGIAAEPVFHQSPLFPILLAAVYADATPPARASRALSMQGVLTALAVALLVPLGRVLLRSHGAGAAAGALALLYGPILFYGLKLLPVSLAIASQALALLMLALARDRPRPVVSLACGACWGLACIARSEILLFLPVAVAAIRFAPRSDGGNGRSWKHTVLFLAGVTALIAPVTRHNLAHGDRVLIAAAAGENLYAGNQRGALGAHTPLHPRAGDLFSQREMAKRIAEAETDRELRPSEVSAYWRGRTVRDIAAAPGEWMRLEFRKLARALDPGDPTDMYSYPLERSAHLPALYLLPLATSGLWILALAGAVAAWRKNRDTAWPLLALIAVHFVVLMVFFVSTRLRLPMLFFLVPFAGYAVRTGWAAWRRGGHARLLAGCVASIVAVACVVEPLVLRPSSREVVRLAAVLSSQNRLDESLATLAPVLVGDDPDPIALDQAGWVHFKKGEISEARELYLRALDGGLNKERETQTRTRLGWVHERLGELDDAERQHDLATSGDGADAGAVYERGMFLLRRARAVGPQGPAGRALLSRARRDFERASRLSPHWQAPREALRSLARPAP